MKILTLPRMPLTARQSFTDTLRYTVEPLQELASGVQQIKTAYAAFTEGMQKKQAVSDKQTLEQVVSISVQQYLQERAEAAEESSASAAAPALEEAISALFKLLFAHVPISGSAELPKAHKERELLLDNYR